MNAAQKKIKKILQQDNYKIVDSRLWKKHSLTHEWRLAESGGSLIMLFEHNEPAEVFNISDVEQVIRDMDGEKSNGVIKEKTKSKIQSNKPKKEEWDKHLKIMEQSFSVKNKKPSLTLP